MRDLALRFLEVEVVDVERGCGAHRIGGVWFFWLWLGG